MALLRLDARERTRELRRTGEIAAVFARHGLGDVLRRAGLAPLLERTGSALHLRAAHGLAVKRPEVRLREAFEELGPAFVKLGQLLSGRPDLLPPAWAEELAKLREDVAPVSFDELRSQLEEDLGAPAAQVFRRLDEQPLAAGSIAQVHRAELADGTSVVLKIRRPGIRETVADDLRLLARLAQSLEEHREFRVYRPRSVVRHFARVLRGELDLAREARNAERIRASLPHESPIVAPRVHAAWTSERLLVMDYLDGPSLGRWIAAGMPGGHDPAHVARIGTKAVLHMVFVAGTYHADPHAGNVILLPEGRLGLIDFGQIGVLTEGRRAEFLELLAAVAGRRAEDAADVLLGWSNARADAEDLEQDCAELIDRYHGVPLGELRVSELIGDIHALARQNQVVFPPDVALLLKLFLTLEALGRALDPGFTVSAHVAPFLGGTDAGSTAVLRQVRRSAAELARFSAELPRDLRRLRVQVRRGRVGAEIDLVGLEHFGARLDRSVNHLTIGLITAALIIGTSVSLTVAGGPRLMGLPLFGAMGFASSIAAGVWWIIVTRRRS